jgi:putative ABC transport system permease protein
VVPEPSHYEANDATISIILCKMPRKTSNEALGTAMETVSRDLLYFLRLCRRSPGFTAVAVATLAVGMGAAIAVFSVVNAVLLRPLPFPNPTELVVFTSVTPEATLPAASATKFNLWTQLTGTFRNVSAYTFGVVNVMGDGESEQVASGLASAEFFQLLGAPLLLGRAFVVGEDRPGAERVAVISRSLWARRFASNAGIAGQTISLNGDPHVIIGVLGDFDASALRSYTGPPEVWLPLEIDPNSTDQGNYFGAVARLAPGVTLDAARARVLESGDEFRRRYPGVMRPADAFGLLPMQEVLVGDARAPLRVLMGAVALLLLTACGNVATLLLARASARGGEMMVRAAVGASQGRLFLQLLTESIVLAVAGGALGLAVGVIGIDALVAMTPSSVTWLGPADVGHWPARSVVIFAFLMSAGTTVIFGLAPALAVARASGGSFQTMTLRRGGHRGHARLRSVLVVSQVAMAVVLLSGATLLLRSLVAMRSVDTGFDPTHVMTMRMSLVGPQFATTEALDRLVRSGLERVRSIPGVVAAGASFGLPLEDDLGLRFVISGRPLDGSYHGMGGWRMVSPGYFDVFKIPVLRGRGFSERDRAGAPGVVIISETLARQFWPDSDPLVDRLVIGRGLGPAFDERPRQIIGIARDVRDSALNLAPRPLMYVPLAQLSDGITAINAARQPLAWVVRTQGAPDGAIAPIVAGLRRSSAGLPIVRVRSMDDVLTQSVSGPAFNTVILTSFGSAALLLAIVGVYGLMSYSIEQRTTEIGIRLALGSAPSAIQWLIARQAAWLALAGLVIGLLGAAGLTQFLSSLLFGVTRSDPLTIVVVSCVLCVGLAAATWYPVRRAGRVAPIIALRSE